MTLSIGDIVRSNSKADIRDGDRLCQIRDIKEDNGKTLVKLLYWSKQWNCFDYKTDRWRSGTSVTSLEENRESDV